MSTPPKRQGFTEFIREITEARQRKFSEISDPDDLLSLAKAARNKADNVVNAGAFYDRRREPMDSLRWRCCEEVGRNHPKFKVEEEKQLGLALERKFPNPEQRILALERLREIEAKRTEILRLPHEQLLAL